MDGPAGGGGDPQVDALLLHHTAPSLRSTDSDIPVYLDRAVAKAMATDPGQRFGTATEFTDAITTGTIVPRVTTPQGRRTRRRAGLAGAAVVVLAGLAWWLTSMVPGDGLRMERLAVLPLDDLTDDPEQAFLVAGVHEALIAELGQLGLSVTARRTTSQYQDTESSIAEIAAELDVDGVIAGSVFRAGDSLEIATRPTQPSG